MALRKNVYLWLDGIEGESHDVHHHGWIEVETFGWSVSNTANYQTDKGASGQGGKSKTIGTLGAFEIHKMIDKASVSLFQACMMGSKIDSGILSFFKLDGETRVQYFRIELTKVHVKGVEWTSEGEEELAVKEKVTLDFATFREFYTVQRNPGFRGGSTEFGFDLETSTAI
jgi:type VI secretion system secreted protein Hcp